MQNSLGEKNYNNGTFGANQNAYNNTSTKSKSSAGANATFQGRARAGTGTQNKQQEYDQELYSVYVLAGNRKYYFNVKKGKRGVYLVIREIVNNLDGSKDRHQVVFVARDLRKVQEALTKVFDFALANSNYSTNSTGEENVRYNHGTYSGTEDETQETEAED